MTDSEGPTTPPEVLDALLNFVLRKDNEGEIILLHIQSLYDSKKLSRADLEAINGLCDALLVMEGNK